LTRLLGSFLGTRGFSNGEQGIKSKKVKGSWEHAPPPWEGLIEVLKIGEQYDRVRLVDL